MMNLRTRLNIVALLTTITGLITLGSALVAFVHPSRLGVVWADAHLTVVAGVSLVYLALLLRRGKHNAWWVAFIAYAYLFLRNVRHFVFNDDFTRHYIWLGLSDLVLPLAAATLLIAWRRDYRARSSFVSFGLALRRALIILVIAFLYGVVGFQLFDHRDFHQEISAWSAAHYTVDQFGLTTNNRPVTYTHRAVLFVDSLAVVSVASLFYIAVSFFAPIRFRLTHNSTDAEAASLVANKYTTTSEDFFKTWPRDKAYFFSQDRSAYVAFKVTRSVALAVGDPVGPADQIEPLIRGFKEHCFINGWAPAFIHTEKTHLAKYRKAGFDSQKIGEEALVDSYRFVEAVAPNKYFRQISNRFARAGYTTNLLDPPHNTQLLDRLEEISNDWLSRPGRAERGFMLGYFSREYMQMCKIFVAQDSTGRVMAFTNLVPSPMPQEANYDFLRQASDSPGNINDFLMMNMIFRLRDSGIKTLNMGLCPLAGLHLPDDSDSNVISGVLNLVYTKAGRFYSFEGLTRFKKKYEPNWQSRYIIYQGGPTGFGRTMTALLKAMAR